MTVLTSTLSLEKRVLSQPRINNAKNRYTIGIEYSITQKGSHGVLKAWA